MTRYPLITLFVVFSLPNLLLAQTPQMVLPDGNGTWLVQVVTTGGILGKGDLDFEVSSEGRMICSAEVRCPKDFKVADFHPLIEPVRVGAFLARPVRAISLCNDCITRRITISFRDSMGIVQTYTGAWDQTTGDQVPQEVIRIYDAFRALMK